MVRMSKDGTKMIFASLDIRDNIYKIEFDSFNEKVKGQPVAVTKGSRQFGYPSVSYDDKWIAVNSLRQQEAIYIMRSDGSDISKLTNELFKDRGPKWTPDGKSLIFYSDRTGKYDIWRINIDGSNLKKLTNFEGMTSNPFLSPDGKSIICWIINNTVIFHPGSTANNQYMMLPDLNEKGFTFYATSVSPDGNYLAGNNENITDGNDNGILIYSLIQKKYRKISETGRNPEWLNDGKRIFFEDNNKFYLINAETGVQHLLYDPKIVFPKFDYLALSHDNKFIYYVNEEKESDIWMGYLQ